MRGGDPVSLNVVEAAGVILVVAGLAAVTVGAWLVSLVLGLVVGGLLTAAVGCVVVYAANVSAVRGVKP